MSASALRTALEEHASLDFLFSFRYMVETAYRDFFDNVLRAGEWGAAPGIMVPDSTQPEVIHAAFGEPKIQREDGGLLWSIALPFESSAYGVQVK